MFYVREFLFLKEGEYVDIRGQVKEIIVNKSGIAKSADFVAAGISAVDVVNLCNAGVLSRVRHGYYELIHIFQDLTMCNRMLCILLPGGSLYIYC